MKNKLLKILTCFAGISVIGSTASVISTSCSDNTPVEHKVLPEEVYNISADGTLLGFKDEFLNDPDSDIYKDNFTDYDTMEIPSSVTNINGSAFYNTSQSLSTIPLFITRLTFAENSQLSKIGYEGHGDCFRNCTSLISIDFSNCFSLSWILAYCFAGCSSLTSIDLSKCNSLSAFELGAFEDCTKLTSITLPSSLSAISFDVFKNCSKLNNIKWVAWDGKTSLYTSFSGVPNEGTITVIDSIDDQHDSAALLTYLITNGGLPKTWTVGS